MLGFLITLHVFFAVLLILVILMQQSHGAGMSSVFGGGGSGSLFGGRGASIFLRKVTIVLAALFFLTSTTIAIRIPRVTKTEGGKIEKKLRKGLSEEKVEFPLEEIPETPVEPKDSE
ncbi:MAG: preprotein translocase subunit SecG [candidate division WOR-3 bacterium]